MRGLDWIDMIEISGLTERQRQLCDLMWSCRDLEHVRKLIAALPTEQDQQDATTLMIILVHESLETQGGLNDYSQHCADVIDRVSSR